jgi:FkbM family methyltransferase
MIIESEMEKYRYETWDTKEPETIAWISSFGHFDIFYDIGANIGIYSLFSAVRHPKSMIYAVEPERRNYERLKENIALNKFWNIQTYNIAMSNKCWIAKFHVPNKEIGSSGGQLREAVDERGNRFEPEESYLVNTLDLAGLIETWHIWPPNHIKIDVDGKESEIMEGLYPSIGTVKSILVEFNHQYDYHMQKLIDLGFSTENEFNKMENHSRVRRAKEGIDCENIVFTRRD